MRQNATHTTLKGEVLSLASLDTEELQLVERAHALAEKSDWNAFDRFIFADVVGFYDNRGMPRAEAIRTVPYKLAQDLSNRLAVAAGKARVPDYRDELQSIIRERFATRREFCEATGISESLLSHVLHDRKDFALDTLEAALERVGYRLRIVPRDMA